MVAAAHPHLSLLYPDFHQRMLRAIHACEERTDIAMLCPHGIRPWKKQAELFAIGRTKVGACQCEKHPMGKTVTSARPGYSCHQFGVAADVAFNVVGDPYLEQRLDGDVMWRHWGEAVHDQGLEWGGDWKSLDRPHAQICYGLGTEDMRFFYYQGGIEAVWEEFDRRRGVRVGDVWSGLVPELLRQGFGKPTLEAR